jgi:hypothetical protein
MNDYFLPNPSVPSQALPATQMKNGTRFTPAAAVAAIYAFLIANLIYCDMGPFKEKGAGGVMIL